MTGTGECAIARATISSLNAQRSYRSATASDDDDIDTANPTDRSETASDVERCAIALNPRRANHDVHVAVPAAEHVDDVSNRGSLE